MDRGVNHTGICWLSWLSHSSSEKEQQQQLFIVTVSSQVQDMPWSFSVHCHCPVSLAVPAILPGGCTWSTQSYLLQALRLTATSHSHPLALDLHSTFLLQLSYGSNTYRMHVFMMVSVFLSVSPPNNKSHQDKSHSLICLCPKHWEWCLLHSKFFACICWKIGFSNFKNPVIQRSHLLQYPPWFLMELFIEIAKTKSAISGKTYFYQIALILDFRLSGANR